MRAHFTLRGRSRVMKRMLVSAACLLFLPASGGGERQEELTINVRVTWTGSYALNRSQGGSHVQENDQLTVTYDGRLHKKSPAGTRPWELEYSKADEDIHVTVSGGGSGTAQSKDGTFSESWTWRLKRAPEASSLMSIGSGSFKVQIPPVSSIEVEAQVDVNKPKDIPGAVIASLGTMVVSPRAMWGLPDPPSSQPPYLPGEEGASASFWGPLTGTFDPDSKSFSRSGSASYRRPTITFADGSTMTSFMQVSYSLNFNQETEDVEAVLVPDSNYDEWMPEAGKEEDTAGNGLTVHVELQKKDQPGKKPRKKAQFTFELVNVSKEPGICSNAPPKEKAKSSLDLKIDPVLNTDLKVADDGQSASSAKGLQEADVSIMSYDWGAYGELKVTAELDDGSKVEAHLKGKPGQKKLTIPRDVNHNHAADKWEKDNGVFDRNLAANWDGAEEPKDQKAPGDGISLYEKYRGFEFDTGHERLDPQHKYLFVYDPEGVVSSIATDPLTSTQNFQTMSGIRVRFVDSEQWTGRGKAQDKKRIVNFNHDWGHATEQHGLFIHTSAEKLRLGSDFGANEPLAMSWPDGEDEALGSPVHTLEIEVYLPRLWERTESDLRFLLCQVKGDRECMSDLTRKAAVQYLEQHQDEAQAHEQKQLAWVITHEMSHGVGVKHHDPDSDGDPTCAVCLSIWYDRCSPEQNAQDPLQLRCWSWPNKLCLIPYPVTILSPTGPVKRMKEFKCWRQVIVSDRSSQQGGT